ncbi:MAG: hypothetical protein GY799_20670 [Desulfobulbaceae bacterium]|nr:hypothetical protein [Desulfobulbaceae bacterium]
MEAPNEERKKSGLAPKFENNDSFEGLGLSSSVVGAHDLLQQHKVVDAAAFAAEILTNHADYVGGKAIVFLLLKETPTKLAVSEWLDDLKSLFEPR